MTSKKFALSLPKLTKIELNFLNSFIANVPILYHLEKPENQTGTFTRIDLIVKANAAILSADLMTVLVWSFRYKTPCFTQLSSS